MTQTMEATVAEDTVIISGVVEEKGVTLMIANRNVAVRPDTGSFQTTVPLDEGPNNIEVLIVDRAGNSASDVLHITYRPEGVDEASIGETLGEFWWVFAVVIALVIVIPLTVHSTRDTWVQEHPELEDYDSKKYREGLYEYVEDEGYDEYAYDEYQDQGGRY
jgi:hypothetical protein